MSAILDTAVLTRPVLSRVDHSPLACDCGQDLEPSQVEHCPRCGTHLGARRRESIGFAEAA